MSRDHSQLRPLDAIANQPMFMSEAALDAMMTSAFDATEMVLDGWSPEGSKPEHLITTQNGTGTLSIRGPLFKEYGVTAWWFGGTGYDVIRGAFRQLLQDASIKQIVLDIDSPGGSVKGAFETADAIFQARGIKPILAFADDAFSAGYLLASAADTVTVGQTSGVGSVGVVSTHVDLSGRNSQIGIKYEYVFAGEKKVDFRQDGPLDSRARADLQAEVDRLYGMLVEAVARNRGMDAAAVRATQAGVYFGPLAKAIGFADAVSTAPEMAAPKGRAAPRPAQPATKALPQGLTASVWRRRRREGRPQEGA